MKYRTALLVLVPLVLFAAWPAPSLAREPAVEAAKEKLAKNATDPFEQRGRESAIRDLGKLGGKAAAQALLEVFEDPFEHLADHAVSAWMKMLEGDRGAETREWLADKALRHRNPDVRHGAATALGRTKQAGARDAVLGRLAKERDEGVLQALLGAWPALGGGTESVVWKLLGHKSGAVALAAADALVGAVAARSVPPGERTRLLSHRHPLGRAGGVLLLQATGGLAPAEVEAVVGGGADEPKIALVETIGEEVGTLPWEAQIALLGRLLGDASWRVRAAAVGKASGLWHVDVVPLLVERLGREDGRLRLEVYEALVSLTDKSDLGFDADLWRAWWEAKGEGFELGRRPDNGSKRADEPAHPKGESRTAAFFRLPVVSKRLAFLLDCSGSMRNPALGEKVGGATKMEVAREELEKTLGALDEDTTFDVFLYRYPSEFPPKPYLTRAFKKPKACKPAVAREAVAWLAKDRQEPKGWGAFYDALKLLMEMDEVDTIFFLSDGRPSRGRYDRDFRLIEEIARDNRFRQVAIHTVLVGTSGADKKFMERLAATTRGHFVDAVPAIEEAHGK